MPADRVDATGIGPARRCAGGGSAVEIVLSTDTAASRRDPASSEVDFFEADLAGSFSRDDADRLSLRDAARTGLEAIKANATLTTAPGARHVGRVHERTWPAGAPATEWRAPEQLGQRPTVVVRGRPDEFADARPYIAAERRRAETLESRLTRNPDRLAGWAVGLGLILVLTAVSTADAAVRVVGG